MKEVTRLTGFCILLQHLRKDVKRRTLRETALAIGVSPQYYSEVEKGRKAVFTADKLEKLVSFLGLSKEEEEELYTKAAEAQTEASNNISVPQDFSDYIVEREYAMQALRTAKELNADAEDWQRFIDDLRKRKEKGN